MGVPKVCSVSDPCMTGTCDETDKTCTSMPGEDGTPCDLPDNACFIDAVCLTGVCTGETPVDCSFLDSPCGTGRRARAAPARARPRFAPRPP
jgi:hypothetical protein